MNEIESLKNLLLDNSLLEEMEEKINMKPNFFSILKITNAEIRHSNFLAWLLNPMENHGLNQVFLEELIKWYVKEYIQNDKAVKLLLAHFNRFQIRREWKNIDLLLISEIDKIAIAIENKIYSQEHNNQLEKYYRILQTNFPEYDCYFAFLTLDGSEATQSKEIWHPISYNIIIEKLEYILEKYSLNEEIELIIKHYIETVRSLIEMENPEIKELCMQIYEKHKKAIDLIIENIPREGEGFINDLNDWVANDWSKKLTFKNTKAHKWYEFTTPIMDSIFPKQNGNIAYKYYICADSFFCKIGLEWQALGIVDTNNYELAKKIDMKINHRDLASRKGQKGQSWVYYSFKTWPISFENIDEISYADYADKLKMDIEKVLFEEIPKLEEQIKEIQKEFGE